MDRSLVLISKKQIVIQIFTLVCKKLRISLEVLHDTQIDHKVDMIILDNEFIDERFNILKTYTKMIGAVSKKELPFEFANDFIIPIPFLPSTLQEILEKQLEILEKRSKSKTYVSNVEIEDDEYDEFSSIKNMQKDDPEISVKYLESLANEIAEDMDGEIDDSVVSKSSVDHGGVLDRDELSIIESIIAEQHSLKQIDHHIDDDQDDEDRWEDLSSIIDQAIDEANSIDTMGKMDKNGIDTPIMLSLIHI